MKSTTQVFAKFESIGKPKETQLFQGTVHETITAYARWMMGVYMGSHIRLTMARTATELNAFTTNGGKAVDSDLLGELEDILSQDGLDLESAG